MYTWPTPGVTNPVTCGGQMGNGPRGGLEKKLVLLSEES